MADGGSNTIPIFISCLALVASVGNYWYTYKSNRQAKKFDYKLQQWNFLREEINRECTVLRDRAIELRHGNFNGNLAQAKGRLRELSRNTLTAHSKLTRCLIKADNSSYANCTNSWLQLGLAPGSEAGSCADTVGELINEHLQSATSAEDLDRLADRITVVWLETLDAVEAAVRTEEHELDPNFQSHLLG